MTGDAAGGVEARCPDIIIIGVHGVGSPALGEVAESIRAGYARALGGSIVSADELSLQAGAEDHVYRGFRVREKTQTAEIWEVNWADLKGFPAGTLGSILYALKTLVALIQVSDAGWNQKSRGGPDGRFYFGFLLRLYFCTFALIVPVNLLLIAYASLQANRAVAVLLILLCAGAFATAILLLGWVDRFLRLSLVTLAAGVATALWIVSRPVPFDRDLLIRVIGATGWLEKALGIILLFCLIELLVRSLWAPMTVTISVTRAAIMILAASIGAGAYGAIVNAVGLFALDRIDNWKPLGDKLKGDFEQLYLDHIGYSVAQLELINGGTTFVVGAFLIGGIVYQLIRVGLSPDNCQTPRGRYVQDTLNVFLWLALAGFVFVFVCSTADAFDAFRPWNDAKHTRGSIYGIQWLLRLFGVDPTIEVHPLSIYLFSSARIVPFLLPAMIRPLRDGMNVAADVLLYVLPPDFKLSLAARARDRFGYLFGHFYHAQSSARLCVLAHSQGAVVAYDVLSSSGCDNIGLLTAGSPLGSLYERFLGYPVERIPGIRWTNIYRESDYVGGPIKYADIDEPLRRSYPSAHFYYFEDRVVISKLLRLGEDQAAAAAPTAAA
jgi:hypothetical protein